MGKKGSKIGKQKKEREKERERDLRRRMEGCSKKRFETTIGPERTALLGQRHEMKSTKRKGPS